MLKCVYINLDRATQRRAAIEASFAAHARPGFELARFAAISTDDVVRRNIEGKARLADRACNLSHRQVILDHPADATTPLMVLEDDVEFGPTFFRSIDQIIAPDRFRWDILFTDVCVPDATLMARLARTRPHLAEQKQVSTFDLRRAVFAALAAYIINPKSLRKLQDLLRPLAPMDVPYDMHIRKLVHNGTLTAACTFPFLTTLSSLSEDSAIQPDEAIRTDLVWNTFRKVMWVDRNLDDCRPRLKLIEDTCCDPESLLLAPILCAMASSKYKTK